MKRVDSPSKPDDVFCMPGAEIILLGLPRYLDKR